MILISVSCERCGKNIWTKRNSRRFCDVCKIQRQKEERIRLNNIEHKQNPRLCIRCKKVEINDQKKLLCDNCKIIAIQKNREHDKIYHRNKREHKEHYCSKCGILIRRKEGTPGQYPKICQSCVNKFGIRIKYKSYGDETI